jgi:ferritin-like metal-binding protein YciE
MSTLVHGRDLFFLELAEVLWIERTLSFEVLPKLIDEVRDEELKQALSEHLEETRFHAARVEQAFQAAGAEATAARSAAFDGMKGQHESQEVKEPTLRDVFHAGAAVRTEHLELAIYDSLLGLAKELDLRDSADLLQQNRKEEDKALDRVAGIGGRLRGALPQ